MFQLPNDVMLSALKLLYLSTARRMISLPVVLTSPSCLLRIACFGDSRTVGCRSTGPIPLQEWFTTALEEQDFLCCPFSIVKKTYPTSPLKCPRAQWPQPQKPNQNSDRSNQTGSKIRMSVLYALANPDCPLLFEQSHNCHSAYCLLS
jgi:hypothetical protein